MDKNIKLGPYTKLGPSTNIHEQPTPCFPSHVGPDEKDIQLTKIPILIVGNKQYQQLVNGHKYLVYRDMGDNVEPSFSICIYKEGTWIPEAINYMNANGMLAMSYEIKPIPVEDNDWYVDLMDFVKSTKPQEPVLHDIVETKPEDPNMNNLSLYEFIVKRIDLYREKLAREAEENERLRLEAEHHGIETTPVEKDPIKEQIDELNLKIDTIIGWLDANLVDSPTLDHNWEHIKILTNDILDRLAAIEQRQQTPWPSQPITPNTPLGPGYPEPQPVYPGWPFGPVISYAIPGVGPQCVGSINELKELLYKNNPQSTGDK